MAVIYAARGRVLALACFAPCLLVCYITLAPFYCKIASTALTCTESRQRRSMHAFRLARIGARAAARLCSPGQLPAARRASSTAACIVAVATVAAGTTAAACDFDESPRDAYGGITVVVRETQDFDEALTVSLDRWRRDGVRGVWLEAVSYTHLTLPTILLV